MIETGQRVEDQYGEKGYVNKVFINFFDIPHLTMDKQSWLDQQLIPFTQEELDEPWYQVICDDGGSINSCESRLKII